MILRFLIIADLILSLASLQNENDNKLILEPIDIIDFILEEHVKNSNDKDLDYSNLDNSGSEKNEEVTFTGSKETSKDSMQKASTKIPIEAYSTTDVDTANKNSFWVYRPISRANDLSIQPQELSYHNSKPVQYLTRLRKSLILGADPYFNKDYFEPFEKRAKPITLVTFRKKGMLLRKNIQEDTEKKQPEVAELQSPYNEVGTLWLDEFE